MNLGNVLGAIGLMTASMELTLAALILWLLAVLNPMTFGPTVETFVVSRQRVSFTLTLLLIIPQEGTNVFPSSWP